MQISVLATMVWAKGGYMYTRIRYGTPCFSAVNTKEFLLGKIVPGQWHTVVIGASWRANNKGWFRSWFDGEKKVDVFDFNTIHNYDSRRYEFRVGLYPNWYAKSVEELGAIGFFQQRTKAVVFDNIRFGFTFDEADPSHLRE